MGAVILAWPLFVMRERDAVELARPLIPTGPTDDHVRVLPSYLDLIRGRWFARVGLGMLVLGFVLQLVGGWLQLK